MRFVVAFSLAVIVWGYVIATQYPERTSPPFDVALAEATLPPGDLVPVFSPNEPHSVTVTVSGPADQINLLTPSQIKPYLDLSQYKLPGNFEVSIHFKPGSLPDSTTATVLPKTIKVTLENKVSKSFSVQVVPEGEVSPDYSLEGEIQVSPQQVTVSGRQGLVDRVARVAVPVPLAGRVGRLAAALSVKLYDSQNQLLPETDLTISPSTVNVTANINYKLSTRLVPIRVITHGEVASGYIAGTARVSPVLATIYSGNGELLNGIQFIATTPVDITDKTGKVIVSVPLQAPSNITVQGVELVKVEIDIVPFATSKRLSVPLQFINGAANLRYDFNPSSNIDIVISGPYQAFQEFPLDQVRAVVDLKDQSVGDIALPVLVDLPMGLALTNSPTVNVRIRQPPPPTATPVPPTRTPVPTSTPSPTATPTVTPGPTSPVTTPPTTPIARPTLLPPSPGQPTVTPPGVLPPEAIAPSIVASPAPSTSQPGIGGPQTTPPATTPGPVAPIGTPAGTPPLSVTTHVRPVPVLASAQFRSGSAILFPW